MDKEWMSKSRLSMEYENGVEYFLNFAIENGKDPNSMSCPCVKCGNQRDADLKTIRAHLTYNGIDLTYRCWILHGDRPRSHTTNIEEGSTVDRDEPVDMEHDVFPKDFIRKEKSMKFVKDGLSLLMISLVDKELWRFLCLVGLEKVGKRDRLDGTSRN